MEKDEKGNPITYWGGKKQDMNNDENEQCIEKMKPTLVEVFHDDGSHSHWSLVETETGVKLWSENPEECKAQGYPVKQYYQSDNKMVDTSKGYDELTLYIYNSLAAQGNKTILITREKSYTGNELALDIMSQNKNGYDFVNGLVELAFDLFSRDKIALPNHTNPKEFSKEEIDSLLHKINEYYDSSPISKNDRDNLFDIIKPYLKNNSI